MVGDLEDWISKELKRECHLSRFPSDSYLRNYRYGLLQLVLESLCLPVLSFLLPAWYQCLDMKSRLHHTRIMTKIDLVFRLFMNHLNSLKTSF